MRVLLTGATGFVGHHTLKLLIDKGYDVLSIKRIKSNINKLGHYAIKSSWVNIDSDDWVDLIKEFSPSVIVHLAWEGVDAQNRDNWTQQISNIVFQQKILDVAVKVKASKIVGLGSQAEYGIFEGCINEDYDPHPNSAYGVVKLAAMQVFNLFCTLHNIGWYWFRLFSCFGEGESSQWLIPSTIHNILHKVPMEFTQGKQKYSYLYVGEVAAAIVAAVETKAPSGVYNISSDQAITIKDLLIKIRDYINPQFDLKFGALPYRKGQSMWVQGDISKLRNNIYRINSQTFEQCLVKTINYYTNESI